MFQLDTCVTGLIIGCVFTLDYSEVILHITPTLRLGEGLGVNMKLAYISENGDSFIHTVFIIQYTSFYNFYPNEEFHKKKTLRNNFKNLISLMLLQFLRNSTTDFC